MADNPLLSIAIPTYNRAPFLDRCLESLLHQLSSCSYAIEVLVSDNCSNDNTTDIVKKYQSRGCTITYVRNEENLGMDGNFASCIKQSKGKYIWLLGDDDYLKENALQRICEIICKKDYGLVHIDGSGSRYSYREKLFSSPGDFISEVNVFITFISGNIFSSKVLCQVDDSKYAGTFLTQVPYYLAAANSGHENVIISDSILDTGAAATNNGGYNFAKVFFHNYMSILTKCVKDGILSSKHWGAIKKSTYIGFYRPYIVRSIIGLPSQSLDMSGCVGASLKYYWKEPYYYYFTAKDLLKWFGEAVKRRIN